MDVESTLTSVWTRSWNFFSAMSIQRISTFGLKLINDQYFSGDWKDTHNADFKIFRSSGMGEFDCNTTKDKFS